VEQDVEGKRDLYTAAVAVAEAKRNKWGKSVPRLLGRLEPSKAVRLVAVAGESRRSDLSRKGLAHIPTSPDHRTVAGGLVNY
jgi:hypothetical protein